MCVCGWQTRTEDVTAQLNPILFQGTFGGFAAANKGRTVADVVSGRSCGSLHVTCAYVLCARHALQAPALCWAPRGCGSRCDNCGSRYVHVPAWLCVCLSCVCWLTAPAAASERLALRHCRLGRLRFTTGGGGGSCHRCSLTQCRGLYCSGLQGDAQQQSPFWAHVCVHSAAGA